MSDALPQLTLFDAPPTPTFKPPTAPETPVSLPPLHTHYPHQGTVIPVEKRGDYNTKVLHLVRSGDLQGLSKADLFNAFTGKGGLHGERFLDYGNYHAYAVAKRGFEQGQFFTPDFAAAFLTQCADLTDDDLVCDPACGAGALFNHVPHLNRVYGNEIDHDAFAVAQFLWPEAHLQRGDFRTYHPQTRFTTLLSNPPFSLRLRYEGEEMSSQEAFLRRCADWLQPGGLLAMIVPASFLADDFQDQRAIDWLNEHFSFLAQARLPAEAFKRVGVDAFDTKAMFLQRRSDALEARPYDPTFELPMDAAAVLSYVRPAREAARAQRARIYLENRSLDSEAGQQRDAVAKLLFHIGANPRTRGELARCQALVDELQEQRKPEHLTAEEWEAVKLTWPKVLGELKSVLSRQHLVERDEVRLVRTATALRLKGYSATMRDRLDHQRTTEYPIQALTLEAMSVPPEVERDPQFRAVRRRRRLLEQHDASLPNVTPDDALVQELMAAGVVEPATGKTIHPTRLQAEDLARLLPRRYTFLAWQQGTGKTLAGYLWQQRMPTRATFICAPALAVERTWVPFLKAQGVAYRVVTTRQQALDIQPGEIVLLSWRRVVTLKRWLRRGVKRLAHKIALLVDEADELGNPDTQQTRAMIAVFRQARYKLLMTGTATRNNPRELYAPVVALLYNHSVLATCYAPSMQVENSKGELVPETNPYYLQPFPAGRRGAQTFSATFSPRRATVFGIQKDSQDLINTTELLEMLDRTRLTRTFREVVGDGLYSIEQHLIRFSPEEAELHQALMEEFHEFLELFESTGSDRKDAGLRAVRQLRLLIESCAHPHLFPQFEGGEYPVKMRAVADLIRRSPGMQVAVGVKRRKAFGVDYLEHWQAYLQRETERPVFIIHGGHSFDERGRIIQRFQTTPAGVLLSTQDALKSSVNIPTVNHVIIPALSWNVSSLSQYFFRFIRMSMREPTRVSFVTYERSIEMNLMQLLVNKERVNTIIREGRIVGRDAVADYLNIPEGVLDELLGKTVDTEGKVTINWQQSVSV